MIELDDSRVYSTKEAAAELGITRTEVQRAIARGVLPFVDRGEVRPRLGVRGQDLRAFADASSATSSPAPTLEPVPVATAVAAPSPAPVRA